MNGRHRPRTQLWLRSLLPLMLILMPLAAACGDNSTTPRPSAPADATVTVQLGDRPFRLYVPRSYTSAQPVPLVVGLHGYTSHSAQMESYFKLAEQARQRGFLYAMPDGTVDRRGDQFWNATNACCDISRTGVDDSTYLSQLIDKVKQSYAVDAGRVYLIGHSNGGYMSHRMACDHADQITAIASLAGVVWNDPSRCAPSRPVSVLQIHGTTDGVVAYAGGAFGASTVYPGTEETVARWRDMNGCTDVADTTVPAKDLDNDVAGAETVVIAYTDSCGNGTRVELWSMKGSEHVPALSDAFTPAVIDFFYASASS
jgi:polyhydroxybutyrate depolymerase